MLTILYIYILSSIYFELPKNLSAKPPKINSKEPVIYIKERAPTGLWPLAVITEVFPSPADNRVRVAKIRINGRQYVRPVHKLMPIF